MSWLELPGWFDWGWHYKDVVARAPQHAILVEVGVAFGRSLAFLVEAARGRPDLEIVAVDPWLPQDWVTRDCDAYMKAPGGFFGNFVDQMQKHAPEVLDRATILRTTSARAARAFDEGEVFSVYIDGDHSEEAVRQDIIAWRPTIKSGGIIGGHDYGGEHTGVAAAVQHCFDPSLVRLHGSTWTVQR